MKKIILGSLIGALTLLLVNSPLEVKAMDSGIMSEGSYRGGYDMGPGMMQYGGYQAHGMGPGMMGPSEENGFQRSQNRGLTDRYSAERLFEDYLNSRHNPNLKLGKIKDEGSDFEADLLTRDNSSLVNKLIVDKNTGRIRTAF